LRNDKLIMVKEIEMKGDERLPYLVATRQAGDPLKGIRELIQNAWDSHDERVARTGETPEPVDIIVKEKDNKSIFLFSDNGLGFDSKEDFEEKIAVMGGEWKVGTGARGEFGIGKGQALGMIYDPDKDNYDGEIEITTIINGEPWTIKGFKVKNKKIYFQEAQRGGEKELGEFHTGTQWKVISNKPNFFEERKIRNYIEDNIKGEYPIKFNEQIVSPPLEGERFNIDDLAVAYFQPTKTFFLVYNRGIKAGSPEIIKGWGGDILTKKSLVTGLARETIHEEDDKWIKIKESIKDKIEDDIDGMEKFSDEQKLGTLHLIAENPTKNIERWKEKKIIKLSDGKIITLRDLLSRADVYGGVWYGDDTLVNSKANDLGYAIVHKDWGFWADDLNDILEHLGYYKTTNSEKAEELQPIRSIGYKSFVKEELNDEEKMASRTLEKIIVESGLNPRTVVFGIGPANAWTDGRTTITFSRKEFSRAIKDIGKGGAHEIRAILDMLPSLIHEMTHDDDDRGTLRHATSDFYEKYMDTEKKIIKGAKKLFKGSKMFHPAFDYRELIHMLNQYQKQKSKELLREL